MGVEYQAKLEEIQKIDVQNERTAIGHMLQDEQAALSGSRMLQPKYFSGVGNWIRAEILYECKIAPNRKLGDLTDSDVKHLYHWSIKILKDAYKVKGLTISNYIDPEGNYGTYKVKVYMQKTDPLGHKVITSVFSDKRTIHWVPEVQI